MNLVLPLLIALPVASAGLLAAVRLPRAWRTGALALVLAICLGLSCGLLAATADGTVLSTRVGGWPAGVAIPLVVDTFSALLLVLTSSVALAVVPFAARTGAAGEPFFNPLVLLLMTGVFGALSTADLFNLFVAIEMMLLPSYALIILAHRGQGLRMQVTAARIYVTVNLVTSNVLLMGIALLYSGLGQVGYAGLLGRAGENATSRTGAALVLLALCVKAAVVPTHGWLARTYPHMSPTVSALFSGLHTKIAVYAIFRLHSVLFGGGDDWTQVGTVVFCVSLVVGGIAALGEHDARAVLTMGMVSQMAYILLGLALHTPAAVAAAIFFFVHNVLTKTSLFLSVGAVETAYGRHRLGDLVGVAKNERIAAFAFGAAALSMVGLPPFSGFVAKVAIVTASFEAQSWLPGVLMLAVSALTLLAMMKIWSGMFLPGPDDEVEEDADRRVGWILSAPALALLAASIVLGFAGSGLLQLSEVAAGQLLHPVHYAAEGLR